MTGDVSPCRDRLSKLLPQSDIGCRRRRRNSLLSDSNVTLLASMAACVPGGV